MKFKVGEFVKKAVSEDNGSPSTMRLLVIGIIAVVLFNWTYFNIANGTLASFDWQDLAAVIGPLFAKAYQKGKEAENEGGQ